MQENITIYPHIFNTLSIDFIMALSNTLKKFLCEFIVCCLPLLHILSVCWILYEFKLTLYLVLDVLAVKDHLRHWQLFLHTACGNSHLQPFAQFYPHQ